jgi:hypothetical protein
MQEHSSKGAATPGPDPVSPPRARRFRWPVRLARAALVVLCLGGAASALAGGTYTLRNGTVAGGGAIVEAGGFRLISTLGEPAMGTTATAEYRLTSGFPATLGELPRTQPEGGIFKDGFESPGSP